MNDLPVLTTTLFPNMMDWDSTTLKHTMLIIVIVHILLMSFCYPLLILCLNCFLLVLRIKVFWSWTGTPITTAFTCAVAGNIVLTEKTFSRAFFSCIDMTQPFSNVLERGSLSFFVALNVLQCWCSIQSQWNQFVGVWEYDPIFQ